MKPGSFVLLSLALFVEAQPTRAGECPISPVDCYCNYEAGLADIMHTYGNDVAGAKPRVAEVKKALDECLSPSSAPKPAGPLGLRNRSPQVGPSMQVGQTGAIESSTEGGMSEAEITLTQEDVDAPLQRWRDAKRTEASSPPNNAKHDASNCLRADWQASNPAQFEYGRLYNACSYPIHVAYCTVGLDCEANKGSIRTLEFGEATRYGERAHKGLRAAACSGRIYPIGQLQEFACE